MSFQIYKEKVNQVMNKIKERQIIKMFLVPFDPKNNVFEETFEMAQPMDLQTIQNKIDNNEYETIGQWKKDINQIWQNCLTSKHYYLALIGKEMKQYFIQLTQFISDSPSKDWLNELEAQHHQLISLIKKNPGIEHRKKRRLLGKRDLLTPQLNETPASSRRNHPPLSQEELQRLLIQINQIKEESVIQEISQILESGPPNFYETNGHITININLLSPVTLHLLQEKMNEIYS